MEKYVKVLVDFGFSKINDFRYEKSVNKEGCFERVSVSFSPLDPDKIFVHITGVHEKKSGYFFEKVKESFYPDSKLKKTNLKKFSTYISELCEETPVISKDDPIDSIIGNLLSSGFILDEKSESYVWRDRYNSLYTFSLLPDGKTSFYAQKQKYHSRQGIWEIKDSHEVSKMMESWAFLNSLPIDKLKNHIANGHFLKKHPHKSSFLQLLDILFKCMTSLNLTHHLKVETESSDHNKMTISICQYDCKDKVYFPHIEEAFQNYVLDGKLMLERTDDSLKLHFPLPISKKLLSSDIVLFKEIVDKLEVTINGYYEEYKRTNV